MTTKSQWTRRSSCDLGGCEVIRAGDNPAILLEGVRVAVALVLIEVARLQHDGREKKLLFDFLLPLLPQRGRENQQNPAAAFGPALGHHDACLNRFSKADFIRKNCSLRKRRAKRE